jgi:hypothetical protein
VPCERFSIEEQSYNTVDGRVVSSNVVHTLPEDGDVLPKHVGATIHN